MRAKMALQSKLKIADRKTRVFISYSRKDIEFARLLHDQLATANFQPMLDQTDIAPGEAWQDRLSKLILQSDAFVFCVSPNSAASKICHWEVDESQRLAKRLVPVVVDPVDTGDLPEAVSKLNFIFFSSESFDEAFTKLQTALNSDLVWQRQHTKIAELADEWENKKRSKSRLLFGQTLSEAEAWVAHQPQNTTPPSSSQLQFIAASRKGANSRQRMALGGSLVALVLALSLFAWGEINRRRTQTAYDAATTAANSLVDDLAGQLKDKPGISPEITSGVLESAWNIQDQLISAGAASSDVKTGAINALNELITVLLNQGQTEKASNYAARAEQIASEVAAKNPSDTAAQSNYALILRKLGTIKNKLGRADDAEKNFKDALAIDEKNLSANPDDKTAITNFAIANGMLGQHYEKNGKMAEAEAALRKQVEYLEKAAAKININVQINRAAQNDLAAGYEQLGNLLRRDGASSDNVKEAVEFLRKDVAISQARASAQQNSIDTQDGLALSTMNLAQALLMLKQDDEGEALLKKAWNIASTLAKDNPLRDDVQEHLSVANNQLGTFYHDRNKDDLAAPYFTADLEASRAMAKEDPLNAAKQHDLAKSLYMAATMNQDVRKNLEEASGIMAALAKAHPLNPDEANTALAIETLKAKLATQ